MKNGYWNNGKKFKILNRQHTSKMQQHCSGLYVLSDTTDEFLLTKTELLKLITSVYELDKNSQQDIKDVLTKLK